MELSERCVRLRAGALRIHMRRARLGVGPVAAVELVSRNAPKPGPGGTYNPRMLGNVLTAIVTPFHEDESIDFDTFQALAKHLVEHGSDGIVVSGTTVESPTLSDVERLDLLRAADEAIGGSGSSSPAPARTPRRTRCT